MPAPWIRWLALVVAVGFVSWFVFAGRRTPTPSFAKYCKIYPRAQTLSCSPGFIQVSTGSTATCQPCPRGHTAANNTCVKLLGCSELAQVTPPVRLTAGGVKTIYKTTLHGQTVVLAKGHLEDDFRTGAAVLLQLTPHARVVQPLGVCLDRLELLLPFHPSGGAHQLDPRTLAWPARVRLAMDYVEIMRYLHNNSAGTRVMCDGNSLGKLLSQFLITTDHRLLLNDVDATPLVSRATGVLIKCGHRQTRRDNTLFVAPEQLWPFPHRPFNDEEMPGYCEKSDVWKLPFVLEHFMQDPPPWVRRAVNERLAEVRRRCTREDPLERPGLHELETLFSALFSEALSKAYAQFPR
eukprot:m.105495 g.105495  ORF g.105495 m.105495 type:complete len:351 (+) comp14196_c0_seq5:99-1151(+)